MDTLQLIPFVRPGNGLNSDQRLAFDFDPLMVAMEMIGIGPITINKVVAVV
jgi:hypothetical protein